MKRIVIAGYYGFGNAGDEAILEVMLAGLRSLRGDLRFTVTSGDPAATAARFGVEAISWTDVAALAAAVRASALVLVGGGGLFHDQGAFAPGAVLTPQHSGIAFYAAPLILAALAGVPSVLYAVGVGPFRSGEARDFTRAAADLAAAITVRDEESRDALAALGVPAARIEVTADPVYVFPRGTPRPSVPPRLGVALRAWGGAGAAWEREAARGVDAFLRDSGAEAVFVPFQRLAGSEADDREVAQRVREGLTCPDRTSVWQGSGEPAALRDVLAECRAVLGMRLHSLILAQRTGVATVALSYDPKVGAAMRRAGREAFVLELPSLRAEALAGVLRQAWDEAPPVLPPELESQARRTAALAIAVLEGGAPVPSWTPAARQLLGRAVTALVESGHALRDECSRLFGEFQFYHRRSEETAQAAAAAELRLRESEAERSRLARELAAAEAERSRLARELAAAEAERSRLARELAAAEAGQTRLASELAAAEAERARLGAELGDVRSQAAGLSAEASALRAQQQAVRRGIDRFRRRLAGDLDVYRSQRAWKAMLLLRQGYTLWRERGLPALLGRAFSLLFRGAGPLDAHDLRFPDVWDYLPAAFDRAPAALPAADAPPPAEARYDIIVLPVFDFEFRFQRPQQLAAEFARRGHRVFWVSPARCLPPDGPEAFRLIPLRDHLWEVQLRGTPPDLYGGGPDPERQAGTAAALGALYRGQHIAASAVFVQFPYWTDTALRLREQFGARILYDCMDDWRNWTAEPRISAFNLAEEQRLADACDVLAASSRELQERETAAGRKAVLVRNGADFAAFSSPPPGGVLADVPRPVIGYYGAIANWFDLELLEAAAAARPDYSFVLIGQVHQVDVSRLARLPNVRLLGERSYRDLPRYLAAFDVCLIPFRVNRLTRAVDPVKLYEYLSQGKPVVATAMGELPADPDLAVTAGSPEEFLAALDRGVAERNDPQAPARRARRIAYARANTWAARADQLAAALRDSFPLVSILIVTYNCEEFLAPCLDSIARNSAWPNYEVIVVDNRSTDATGAVAERYAAADPRIRYLAHPVNAGFAAGNNLAAAAAKGEYLVFLNPDTIVTPGWIHRLVRHCAVEPRLGALAAVTNFSGNETKVDFRYTNAAEMERFALELAENRSGERREVPVAPLYAVMVPRRVWEQVGELDTGYEVGMFEDDDFSVRVRRAGFLVAAAEDCFVHHFGNGSFGKIPQGEALRVFEANRRRFEEKWRTPWRPHTLRPGVRPLDAEVRFEPAAFAAGGGSGAPPRGSAPALVRLHPARIVAGQGFNVQPDGRSAIVAECENATPNSVILFGGQPLPTSFGSPTLLSAVVPEELFACPGRRAVRLASDFGESPETEIEIAPADPG